MVRRHPALPTLWLMTDERQGERLWTALEALPRGSGVVFRHHRSTRADRAALFAKIGAVSRRRRLILMEEHLRRSGGICIARPRAPQTTGWLARAHTLHEAVAARQAGATALFLSPVFATRTHPDKCALGALRAMRIARAIGIPTIALGGMTARRFKRMGAIGFYGWAAIDGLTPPA